MDSEGHLKSYGSLCDHILDEVNVKVFNIEVANTEKGKLLLEWNGVRFAFMLNGEDVTTPRLLDMVAPEVLRKAFEGRDG